MAHDYVILFGSTKRGAIGVRANSLGQATSTWGRSEFSESYPDTLGRLDLAQVGVRAHARIASKKGMC